VAFVLRIINRSHWEEIDKWRKDAANDAPADIFLDFKSESNKLSFWYVDSELKHLPRLITALAIKRDRIDKMDIVLFSEELFRNLNVQLEKTPGDTPDQTANLWHVDVSRLTVSLLANLIIAIFMSPTTDVKRIDKPDIKTGIQQGIRHNFFARDQLNPKIQEGLGD